MKQGDTVFTKRPTRNMDPYGGGEPVTAGEVGYIVGWQGMELAVVRFSPEVVVSVPKVDLTASVNTRGRVRNEYNDPD